jgi:hypothetical protein
VAGSSSFKDPKKWYGNTSVFHKRQQKLQSICAVLTFNPQLKKILTFSVKDRYQLNYFICIKDVNAETNTSLKLNLFSRNHVIWRKKITKFWRNGNDSKQRIIYAYELMNRIYSITAWCIMGVWHLRKNTI